MSHPDPSAYADPSRPRRFRWPIPVGILHPVGATDARWRYGTYFPLTGLCVTDMGEYGTGVPTGVEWLDDLPPGDPAPIPTTPHAATPREMLGRPEGL